jgi:hypothetical protein
VKVKIWRRIERLVCLRYIIKSGKFVVEIQRPYHRKWAIRTYEPKPASLERVKRLVGYSLGPNRFWYDGGVVIKEYSLHL